MTSDAAYSTTKLFEGVSQVDGMTSIPIFYISRVLDTGRHDLRFHQHGSSSPHLRRSFGTRGRCTSSFGQSGMGVSPQK